MVTVKILAVTLLNIAWGVAIAFFPATLVAEDGRPDIVVPRVLIGFQPIHASEGVLKWKPARASDVLKWKEFKDAKAIDLGDALLRTKAAISPAKEATEQDFEKPIGRATVALDEDGINRHFRGLQRLLSAELSGKPNFRIYEVDSKKYVVLKGGSIWARYRFLDDKPELDSFGLNWSQLLEEKYQNPHEWHRFGKSVFLAAYGDSGPSSFEYNDRGWMNWIPTWRRPAAASSISRIVVAQ